MGQSEGERRLFPPAERNPTEGKHALIVKDLEGVTGEYLLLANRLAHEGLTAAAITTAVIHTTADAEVVRMAYQVGLWTNNLKMEQGIVDYWLAKVGKWLLPSGKFKFGKTTYMARSRFRYWAEAAQWTNKMLNTE
ncbi:hypothetical protein Barb6XT_02991 [Bacteroidales bacterium Barb6XT]|nr:hypothetical protein Barb6XT_02991 [Bacteroidales bacterium Barb6XT]